LLVFGILKFDLYLNEMLGAESDFVVKIY